MQQFKAKLKNTPTGAPQACSSVNPVLNREETLSVQDKVLTLNNLEVVLLQHKGGQGLRVPVNAYVLNKKGQPYDLITVRKNGYTVKGCFNLGQWVSCVGKNFNIKKVEKIYHTSSIYLA